MQILSDIACGIGVPLCFDSYTLNGDADHFSRILVDVDLTNSLLDFVILEVDDLDIEVELHYENFLLFCSACKNVGHGFSSCQLVERTQATIKVQLGEVKDFSTKHVKQVYKLVNANDLDKQVVNKKQVNSSKQNVVLTNAFLVLMGVDSNGKHMDATRVEDDSLTLTDDLARWNGKTIKVSVTKSIATGLTQPIVLVDTGTATTIQKGLDLSVLRLGSVKNFNGIL